MSTDYPLDNEGKVIDSSHPAYHDWRLQRASALSKGLPEPPKPWEINSIATRPSSPVTNPYSEEDKNVSHYENPLNGDYSINNDNISRESSPPKKSLRRRVLEGVGKSIGIAAMLAGVISVAGAITGVSPEDILTPESYERRIEKYKDSVAFNLFMSPYGLDSRLREELSRLPPETIIQGPWFNREDGSSPVRMIDYNCQDEEGNLKPEFAGSRNEFILVSSIENSEEVAIYKAIASKANPNNFFFVLPPLDITSRGDLFTLADKFRLERIGMTPEYITPLASSVPGILVFNQGKFLDFFNMGKHSLSVNSPRRLSALLENGEAYTSFYGVPSNEFRVDARKKILNPKTFEIQTHEAYLNFIASKKSKKN